MNEERNEKLNEVEEVLEAGELTDDETEEIAGGSKVAEIERRERQKKVMKNNWKINP